MLRERLGLDGVHGRVEGSGGGVEGGEGGVRGVGAVVVVGGEGDGGYGCCLEGQWMCGRICW